MQPINLKDLFQELYENYHEQHWWPANSKFEVCIGAILTQNTAWKNVELAIKNLKKAKLLDAEKMHSAEESKIAELIKPSGYYNQKAKALKLFCKHLAEKYSFDLEKMFDRPISELREELLSLHGIGKETADSIILYAANKPIFVIDAYTKRITGRIAGGITDRTKDKDFEKDKNFEDYDWLQNYFHENLKPNARIYNEMHALLVQHAKLYCKKEPSCGKCFLKKKCEFAQTEK